MEFKPFRYLDFLLESHSINGTPLPGWATCQLGRHLYGLLSFYFFNPQKHNSRITYKFGKRQSWNISESYRKFKKSQNLDFYLRKNKVIFHPNFSFQCPSGLYFKQKISIKNINDNRCQCSF